MGVATAGVNLASGNIGLKLAPQGRATAFLASRNFVNSLAMGIAPILGRVLATFFAERELSWTLRWAGPNGGVAIQTLNFQQCDFFFFIAFLVELYSIHRLSIVKEFGEVEERIEPEVFFDLRSQVGGDPKRPEVQHLRVEERLGVSINIADHLIHKVLWFPTSGPNKDPIPAVNLGEDNLGRSELLWVRLLRTC